MSYPSFVPTKETNGPHAIITSISNSIAGSRRLVSIRSFGGFKQSAGEGPT